MNGSKERVSFHPIELSPRGSLEPLRMSERLGHGLKVVGAVGGIVLAAGAIVGVARLMVWGISEHDQGVSDQSVVAWTEIMRDTLRDPLNNLRPGEKFYPSMRVVTAGDTLANRGKMELDGDPVNVRDFPSTYYPDGGPSRVIAQVYPGKELQNVVLTNGRQPDSIFTDKWGAFDCSGGSFNAGAISWQAGMKPEPGEERICAIYGDYLATAK